MPKGMLVTGVLSLILLARHSLCAPQVTGSQREESRETPPPLANPFGSGEENRKLLQSYIKGSVNQGQPEPVLNTWDQEVFFLFSLHDYDRSGHMDGLELMKLISDYNTHNAPGTLSADTVVSMVDLLLQTRDLNQDGLLAPSELLSPPIPQQDSNSHNAPLPQEPEGGQEPHQGEVEPQQKQEDQPMEQEELQIPEAPAAELEQGNEAQVHLGQPEM
ncbi:cell growth regulator with EF hand domain protein 1 isoform X1 [Osmerus eperlanus]|uniref:cell growth regulator with EF hand domain protein 1 isoform X1 n=1 Tax=Osmerus eperlanus TaxID=29151 RepID=UPI002E163D7F